MPKIIENVRGRLLDETKKQLSERGYAATTVRSVAAECGFAVGTVYNYFPSKEILVASFVGEDWKAFLRRIADCPISDSRAFLLCFHNGIREFMANHNDLFSDPDAEKVFASVFSERHKQLVAQLSVYVLPLCKEEIEEDRIFTSRFISETLITLTVRGVEFSQIYRIISKLI
jgi:AcrR family transcriptional regulator